MFPSNDFVGFHASNEGRFFVGFPIEKVFPLYGAEEESKWAPHWAPHWIYPERSVALSRMPERGWIFRDDVGSPNEAVWYVEQFDPVRHEAVYLVHRPEQMFYRIHVVAVPSEGAAGMTGTLTTVAYDFVGLSESGNDEVKSRTAHPKPYAAEMEQWGQMISNYLKGTSS